MQYQKIFFLIILISISAVLISNQLQSTDNISILVNNSGPFIGTSISYQSGYDGSGIVVSIIDTGIDLNHPDLEGQIIGGYDFVDNDDFGILNPFIYISCSRFVVQDKVWGNFS